LEKTEWITVSESDQKLVVRHPYSDTRSPRLDIEKALDDPILFDTAVKPFLIALGNFSKLIIMDQVDVAHSLTDSLTAMKNHFGIESARATFNREMAEILQGDQYVSPVHGLLTGDFMTSSGEVVALTRHGHGKGRDPLARAGFEEALPALKAGALFPTYEAKSVVTAELYGQLPPVGSGAVEVFISPEYTESFRKGISESSATTASVGREDLVGNLLRDEEDEEVLPNVREAPQPDIFVEIPKIIPSFKPVSISRAKISNQRRPREETIETPPNSQFRIPTAGNLPESISLQVSKSTVTPLQQPGMAPNGRMPRPMIPSASPNPLKFMTPNARRPAIPVGNLLKVPATTKLPNTPVAGIRNFQRADKIPTRGILPFGDGVSQAQQEGGILSEEEEIEK
jgi:hypothetical protein